MARRTVRSLTPSAAAAARAFKAASGRAAGAESVVSVVSVVSAVRSSITTVGSPGGTANATGTVGSHEPRSMARHRVGQTGEARAILRPKGRGNVGCPTGAGAAAPGRAGGRFGSGRRRALTAQPGAVRIAIFCIHGTE